MENSFSKTMHNKSDAELQNILDNKDEYTLEAIHAVVWEMENRGLLKKGTYILEEPTLEEPIKEPKEVDQEKNVPVLYSKASIFGFTIFFSTIFGAVLLMLNFSRLGYYKARNQVLVFAIVYTFLSVLMISILPANYLSSLAINVLGYLVLSEVFWNRILGKEMVYEKKSIRNPLAVSILLVCLFIILQLIILQFTDLPLEN